MNKRTIFGAALIISFLLVIIISFLQPVSYFMAKKSFALSSSGIRGISEDKSRIINTRAGGALPQGFPPAQPSKQDSGGASISQQETRGSVYQNMYFQDYGTNVFIAASKDPLSTFGLDVDTASYTIAKNYLMRGELPPTDAIRAEEFINYFDYQYPNPEDTLGITTEMTASPFDEGIYYLKIGIKAREVEERKPAKLVLVVDVSGSMRQENRMGLVKKSLSFLVSQLRGTDEIAIVTYNTQAKLVLPYTSLEEKETILTSIESLTAGGSTNADAGLRLGYQQAAETFDKEYINHVILLSDGVANAGETDPDSIINNIGQYKEKGITLTAIGVGMDNYNDVLLEQIADKADGNYAYVDDFAESKRIFSKVLSGTLQAIAKDAKIQVTFDPSVVDQYRLVGYENRKIQDSEFRDDEKDAGEIGAGHQVTALYELKLTGAAGSPGRLSLRYKEIDSDLVKEVTKDITSQRTTFNTAPDRTKLTISAARFAQILKFTAPPPSIAQVATILENINLLNEEEKRFQEIVYNAKRLIEIGGGQE